jgi:ribokinase
MGVLVVGSANLDYVIRVKTAPGPGETVIGEGFAVYPGGKGANQALACARAGCPTSFLAKIGTEPETGILLESLGDGGVDLSPVVRGTDPTGRAFIVVDHSGENRIVVASGANATLTPEEVEQRWPTDASPEAVLLQLEIPMESVAKSLELAEASDALTVLNPAPSRGSLSGELLGMVDYIVPNRTEAAALLGRTTEVTADPLRTVRELARHTRRGAVITLGRDGAVVAAKGGELWHKAPEVGAVDTTAAGDTFCGYFVAGLVSGLLPEEAVRRAVYAASLACTRPGAQSSIPGRDGVDEIVRAKERRR